MTFPPSVREINLWNAEVAEPDVAAASDATITLTDITTNDVSTTKHGFVPKAPNDTAKYLRGDATWGTPAGGATSSFVSVTKSSTQAIPTTVYTNVTFDTEISDTDGLHSTVTNTDRLTLTAGVWIITGTASFVANPSGNVRRIGISINGVSVAYNSTAWKNVGESYMNVTHTVRAINGDYAKLFVFQDVGSDLNIEGTSTYPTTFSAVKVSS